MIRQTALVVAIALIGGLAPAWSQPGPVPPAATQIGIASLDRLLTAVPRGAGLRAVKILADWSVIEAQRGAPVWGDLDRAVALAEREGLAPVIVLAYTPRWASLGTGGDLQRADVYSRQPPRDLADWDRFVGGAAARYRGRVRDWQVWTQLGLPLFRGTGGEYLSLLRAARVRLKAIDPRSRLAMASPQGMDLSFLVRVLGAGPDLFDIIALSPVGFAPEALLRPLAVLGSRLRATGKAIWVDWSPDPAVPADRAPALWVRAHAVCQAAGVERLFALEFPRVESGLRALGAVLASRPFAGYLVRDPDAFSVLYGLGPDPVFVVWAVATGRWLDLPAGDVRVATVEGQPVAPETREGRLAVRLAETPLIVSGAPAALAAEARATALARGPLLPVVGADRDYSQAQQVSARLGRIGEERGLYNVIFRARRNGAVEPVEIDGSEAVRTAVARDIVYVYFDVDDTFAYFTEGRVPIELIVEVRGARAPNHLGFNILYDSTGGYRFTPWQWVDATDGWVSYVFRLTDATFANTWGWDFAINAAGNRTDDLVVRAVTVRKGAP
jgi:hypothetical protein